MARPVVSATLPRCEGHFGQDTSAGEPTDGGIVDLPGTEAAARAPGRSRRRLATDKRGVTEITPVAAVRPSVNRSSVNVTGTAECGCGTLDRHRPTKAGGPEGPPLQSNPSVVGKILELRAETIHLHMHVTQLLLHLRHSL